MSDLIRLEICDGTAEIILNRPDKRNALNLEMWAAIPNLVAEAENTIEAKVLIFHGGTAGAFAAGADISEFSTVYATRDDSETSAQIISDALGAIERCAKPTFSAIEGACVGGGVSIAMATDLRIAAKTARLGITPAKLGIPYPPGDTRRLLAAVGTSTAKHLLFTGRLFSAEEAKDMRLLDQLVEKGEALNSARLLAREIASNSQWSVRAIKTMIRSLEAGAEDSASDLVDLFVDSFSGEDFQEGYRAFLEKRPAKFPID